MNERTDRPILIVTSLLALTGILMIYSATHNQTAVGTTQYVMQSGWFIFGLIAMYCTSLLPTRFLQTITVPVFVLTVLALAATLMTDSVKGSSRWLRFGAIGIQPSELAKIVIIMALARYLERRRPRLHNPGTLTVACLIVGVPVALILKQPDLGTSLVFGAILCFMLYWAGLGILELLLFVSPVASVLLSVVSGFDWVVWTVFIVSLIALIYIARPPPVISGILLVMHIGVGLVTEPLWNSLHDYQRLRVETFLNPQTDTLGAGYQIIQSKIAIGSGGLMGRGLLQGSQTQLAFLPEQQTDFIFSVIGEELGFLGTIIILGLFYVLIIRSIQIAVNVKGRYQSLLAAGCIAVVTFHVLMNVGMTTGLLPVAGVPLPFLSYGGSSLLTNMVMCGLILNVWRRRYEY